MPTNRKVSPLTIVLLLALLMLLPLGLYTLSTALGATTLGWLLPRQSDEAAAAEARLRQATERFRVPTPNAGSNQILRVRFAATVPTPTPGAVFLPLVSQ